MSTSVARNKQAILEEREKRSPVVASLPYFYSVHLNMPCNQRCIMCVPNGEHARDVLPFDEFLTFFEQVKSYAEHLTLIGGETFMYPWICEVLDVLAQHPIAVSVITNATILNDRVTDRLLALHELHIKCSIDAATRETYRRIRGLDVFDKVTSNLTRFSEQARAHERINIIPVYVVMRENLGEVVPFLDFAKTLDPHRVEFHPVRQVANWHVENGTGWMFDGKEQSCEFFRPEYNAVMRKAAEKAAREGIRCEVTYL
jgi:molybdenum cofactor biosynthesis enzyme MoaA